MIAIHKFLNGHDIGSKRNDATFAKICFQSGQKNRKQDQQVQFQKMLTLTTLESSECLEIKKKNKKTEQSRNHAKEKLIPTSSHNEKIRREVRLKMSQKGVFEYLSAFSKRIMRELYLTPKKSFQRNRQRVSKNFL